MNTDLVLETRAMDRSVNACTDFYRFANGNWLAANPVPADRSRYSSYDEVTERNLIALKAIAEEAAATADATPAARMLGTFYRSGMDDARIDAEGARPLAPHLARIDAIATRKDLLAVIATQHAIGATPLFGFLVDQDAKNTLRYIPQLVQGGLGMPDRDYYLKHDPATRAIQRSYTAHLVRIFSLLGDAPAMARQNAATVMAIETQLARASMSKVALRDPLASYHLMPVDALSALERGIDWQSYFTSIGLAQPGLVNVAQPAFFAEASRMLGSLPIGHWKTYLRWHLVNDMAPLLSSPFVDADFDFKGRTLAGTSQLQPRWKRVLMTIDGGIGEVLGEAYVAKFFTPAAKAGALEMVANVKLAMRDTISGLTWMTPTTKTAALAKLDKVVVKIGYPDTWRDYSSLTIDSGAYADNAMRASQFEFKRMLTKLGKPIDRNEWGMTPSTVNAYYSQTMNEMVFPAGILQPPLFHVDADAASNYGNTGATIGHELTHAFDDEGRQFDADGILKTWWSRIDEKNFVARAAGIEQQFDAYVPIEKLRINGKLTAGENIADLGGLKIALLALEKSLAIKPQPGLIDGLTAHQRFFVAYAQSFRANIRPERLRLQVATDPHAPDNYRVIGPLANMPEFANAFSCSGKDSPLRPEGKRVAIW
ncbi:MAG: M13 family metallopeptidase [Herminiimonas sp.]|nr:M13 family metallopeptidase [Herminiimonas sp.]